MSNEFDTSLISIDAFLRVITQLVIQTTQFIFKLFAQLWFCLYLWWIQWHGSIQCWHSCFRLSLVLYSLCHPGPCPQCPAFITKSCICGRM